MCNVYVFFRELFLMKTTFYLFVFFFSLCFQTVFGSSSSPHYSEFYQNCSGRYYQYPNGVLFVDYATNECFFEQSSFDHLNFPTDFMEKDFFAYILNDESLVSFADQLITCIQKNDKRKSLSRKEYYPDFLHKFEPLEEPVYKRLIAFNLSQSGQLRELFFASVGSFCMQKDMLIYLFCNPLIENNLIQLSYLAHKRLGLSAHEVDKICILSLALFASEQIFNAIQHLRWAVKKGNYFQVMSKLNEGIHPNWVVDSHGITALHLALINQDQNIANLIRSVPCVDLITPNFFGHTPFDLDKKYNL